MSRQLERATVGPRLLLCLVLLSAACTSNDASKDEPSNGSAPLIDRLPNRCRKSPTAVGAAEITFTVGGRLFAANPNGRVRCIADEVDDGRLAWGGETDRLLIDGAQTKLFTPETIVLLSPDHQATSWSRPTGTAVISVSPDGDLLKQEAAGKETSDISFLARHDEAVYHPAGTHIATVGEDRFGVYGLFISNNEGEDDQLIAVGESAKRIYDLAFDHAGDFIYYAAEHRHRFDLHSLKVVKEEIGEDEPVQSRLGTLYSGEDDITKVVVSEFADEPLLAFQTACRAHIYSGGEESPLAGSLSDRNTEPMGWLSDGRLLVLAFDDGCEGPGELYLVDDGEPVLVADGVDAAAARTVLPPAPDPPEVDTGVVA